MSSRFVGPLAAEDEEVLRYLRDRGETGRIRKRAHAILLSAAGQSINEIGKTFEVRRNTVRDWLVRWARNGVCGLADAPRSGKPPILSEEEQRLAVQLLNNEPRSMKTVLHELHATTGKTISAVTLRRIARRSHLRWKRMRRSAKDRRDPVEFARAQEEVADLQAHHCAGEFDLQYFDEAGFSLQPSVPYAWDRGRDDRNPVSPQSPTERLGVSESGGIANLLHDCSHRRHGGGGYLFRGVLETD